MEKSCLFVTTLEIAGLPSVLQALRLPFGKECRSEIDECMLLQRYVDNSADAYYRVIVDPKDEQLLSTLVKRGDEHAKAVRGMIVYARITAPRYWWVEMDTYRVGAERLSSESTMHIDAKGLSGDELVEFKNKLVEGTLQTRIEYFSYQTLRRIYFQRRNHRLPHWHIFCEWIESLPFAKTWITVERGVRNEEGA